MDFYESENEAMLASPNPDNDQKPQEGFTFNWFNLFLGMAILFGLSNGDFLSSDWTLYIYLAVVVIIHELGHVIAGKSFGCVIQEMQVFFLSFVSYKHRQEVEGNSWRDIKWSLGVLPLGGVTIFKSRKADDENRLMTSATSPYIEDKPAWQRLLISAAGVLCNIITFLILFFTTPHMSFDLQAFFWPLMSWSLVLAALNILPVYPLDGGAIVFAIYEILTGKKPSPGFTKACGWLGFIFIVLFFWVFPEWLESIIQGIFLLFFPK